MSHPLVKKYFPNTLNPKPEELGSWNFERMFIPHCVSYVMCHIWPNTSHLSPVTFDLSPVTFQTVFFIFFIFYLFFFYGYCSYKTQIQFFLYPEKIGQSGGASWWWVCYQRGQPRLGFYKVDIQTHSMLTPLIGKIHPPTLYYCDFQTKHVAKNIFFFFIFRVT